MLPSKLQKPFAFLRWLPLLGIAVPSAVAQQQDPAKLEFFEKRVRPILSEKCYGCHSADTKAAGDLRVDDLNGLLNGGNNGPAVVPGDPDKSVLIQRVVHTQQRLLMPKESDPLSGEQIADLRTWIADGAAWPLEKLPEDLGRVKANYEKNRKSHWAYQPLKKPAPPEVADASWPQSEIDRFVLARLEQEKLPPVADATPDVLLRRLTFDLTGLPPAPEALAAFERDPSPQAYEKEVDRLLASRAFGEQWGRHWLDVARYGESTGPSRNIPYPHAWKYKDYVLDAVNRDLPFDRFIQEQIAGDLLPAADAPERDRLLTATGFLALGVKDVNQRFKVRFQMDNVDEKIDTVSRSVLGLTVSCARCHDHKTDPVPTTDYYSLAGIFTSTEDGAGVRNKMGGGGLDYYDSRNLIRLSTDLPPPPAEQVAELEAKVAEAKKAWDEIRGTPEGLKPGKNGQPTQRPFRVRYERAQADLMALTDPAAQGYAVHGVREAAKIADTQVRIRGEAERLGPVVPRGFLTAFEVPGAPTVNPAHSGRLELAQWLTSPANPLTPRVIANRTWQHLFGRGLVVTTDNFGVTGDKPSHPELLDYLASRFIEEDWSVKKLVRELVLSRAYRLGSDEPEDHHLKDPANRLVWRHTPRRMAAEEIRDSILSANGRLLDQPHEEPAVKKLRMVEIRDNGQEAKAVQDRSDRELARSIYLPLLRGMTPKSLEAFDPVSQTLVTGRRDATTVPGQALFFLNSSFVRGQALTYAESLAKESRAEKDKLHDLYARILGRQASESDLARAQDFIGNFAANWQGQQASPPESVVQLADNAGQTGDGTTDNNAAVNPDDMPRNDLTAVDTLVEAKDANSAAWMALIQALYASAEFRFIR
ncbi:PSD1 and planctomycete cytochrome C domain-containing protein [Haloferula sp. BvORR071]|uniref:PSD1 and planctomycete cytochrome C domain-containing protein n=1 Tax=Haloferula sp. BvORR071 TaxID=1396141 RepID=UPI00055040A2|nr:PSD1 and planctomycete cytochrome C domain-containing protein [Haloferula sp. BvORR071]